MKSNKPTRTDSSYADAHDSLGLLLAVRGELREATEHFYQALKLDPARSEPTSIGASPW